MTDLGPDWRLDSDGIPHREAARVVLFSSDDEVLLLHGHDGHDSAHQWWFTVGGGIEQGETPGQCALREVREETGIILRAEELVGPVMYRQADFHFRNVYARQDEWFFLARLERKVSHLDESGRTEMEGDLLDDHAWLSLEALEAVARKERVYPVALPELVRGWLQGWDGHCLRIEEREREG